MAHAMRLSAEHPAGTSRNTVKLMLAIAIVAAIVVAMVAFDVRPYLESAVAYVRDAGPVGIVVFALVYVAACVFLLPGSMLTLGAGFIYGIAWGTAIVSASSVLGATVAFLLGRYMARDWIEGKVAGGDRFRAIDAAVGKGGFKIVLLTRLTPAFPFNLLNYAYGLTAVRLRDYVVASWIGMLPGTLMYVYFGSLLTDLAGVGQAPETHPALKYVIFAITVVVTVWVTRIAKRAFDKASAEITREGAADDA